MRIGFYQNRIWVRIERVIFKISGAVDVASSSIIGNSMKIPSKTVDVIFKIRNPYGCLNLLNVIL